MDPNQLIAQGNQLRTDRDSSPWYSTARLFRQTEFDQWDPVTKKVAQYLAWFKVE